MFVLILVDFTKASKIYGRYDYDMAGSAVVVGLMKNFALRKAKTNAVGVVGLLKICLRKCSKTRRYSKILYGKTIEVLNTDAEGRLALADALSFTEEKFNPN